MNTNLLIFDELSDLSNIAAQDNLSNNHNPHAFVKHDLQSKKVFKIVFRYLG